MHTTTPEQAPEHCVLAAVDLGEYDVEASLDELEELVRTAGGEVLGRISQRRTEPDPATCIGAGRLEELAALCRNTDAELCVFNSELSASEVRNLENALDIRVIDRTQLILDIFAGRAVTAEGKLQVELAQQKYRLPRLGGQGHALSRLGGGIGTRGPGESKLESDRRHVRRRITALEAALKDLSRQRNTLAEKRRNDGVLTVAITGYTNAGKSTLLNRLTGSEIYAADRLFATLDPTSRGVELPDGRIVLFIDTVGFISQLPHNLVEAFKSTLEVAVHADLVLAVCDASSPAAEEQQKVTIAQLQELGVRDDRILQVLNKCDKLPEIPHDERVCMISAATGCGLDILLERVARRLPVTARRLRLLLPYSEAGLLAAIRSRGRVYTEEFEADGIRVDATVDQMFWKQVQPYLESF